MNRKLLRAVSRPLYAIAARALSHQRFRSLVWGTMLANRDSRSLGGSPESDFLLFAMAKSSLSGAQLFQDLWILWETGQKQNGYFVEFGATDGVYLSNTLALEKHFGWRGILAEPFPSWHAKLAANRSAIIDHRCVWHTSGESLSFTVSDVEPEYGSVELRAFDDVHAERRRTLGRRTMVRTVSLNDLLAEHSAPAHIDYMSIDTEGSELDILSAFDFSRYQVDFLSVEHNYDSGKRSAIESLLRSHGYVRRFEAFSRFDDWFARKGAA